jgi:hypothetical protein
MNNVSVVGKGAWKGLEMNSCSPPPAFPLHHYHHEELFFLMAVPSDLDDI